jgi:hypothetical protein
MSAKNAATNVAENIADKVVEAVIDTGYVTSGVFVPKKAIYIGTAVAVGVAAALIVAKRRKSRKAVEVEVTETTSEPITEQVADAVKSAKK